MGYIMGIAMEREKWGMSCWFVVHLLYQSDGFVRVNCGKLWPDLLMMTRR